MEVKEIFEKADGAISYEQFEELAKSNNAKFVDLTPGGYISENKYKSDIQAKDTEIEGLKKTISTRDADLKDLNKKLKEAGTDADKLTTLSSDLAALQGKYDEDIEAYKQQLAKQAYDFAVKEFAGTKKFSSTAARRDFERSMIAAELKMDKDNNIMGAEDFAKTYAESNADAFQTVESEPPANKPRFVDITQGVQTPQNDPTGGFASAFHFSTVRPMPQK